MLLAGDFNGWNPQSTPMTREPGGWWSCRLQLNPGTYQFRYLGDGEWFTDYAAFGLERTPFGWNSVITVTRGGRSAA
jgi:1,4-alpha-glucan branching enzyme